MGTKSRTTRSTRKVGNATVRKSVTISVTKPSSGGKRKKRK